MDRRAALSMLITAPVALACESAASAGAPPAPRIVGTVAKDLVLGVVPLGFQWKTIDPFLFCAHHDDSYPAGNPQLGPQASLQGRNIGSDFTVKDGFRMYHGSVVPGFPEHPHRGFETVTIVRRGLVDHSDSLGAAARYGGGDVQWLTAGNGIVHAEMFPLLEVKAPNPLELFQIWVNLPSTSKLVAPHFSMLWNPTIPRVTLLDTAGRPTEVTIIAGRVGPTRAPSPPPNSWASRAENEVAIWAIRMAPNARFEIPAASPGVNRMAYFFRGSRLKVGDRELGSSQAAELRGDLPATLENGDDEGEILLLQGRPIAEPVAQSGPFVMNTREEIQKAYADYRATGFGGWPWKRVDPVHDREARFARHADGHFERGV